MEDGEGVRVGRGKERERERDPWADLEQGVDSARTREERRTSQFGPSKVLDEASCPEGGVPRP